MTINKNMNDIKKVLEPTQTKTNDNETKLIKFSPKWFKEKNKEFPTIDNESLTLYKNFQTQFGISALESLKGEEILKKLFIGLGLTQTTLYLLEYSEREMELFGSIKGRSSYKYPLYFSKKDNAWMTGTPQNRELLTLEKAIEKGTEIKNDLIQSLKIIEELKPFNTSKDYLKLYFTLKDAVQISVSDDWILKYFHMMYPEVFPVFYRKNQQKDVISLINLKYSENTYERLGVINEFIKKCEISNVVFGQIFNKYTKGLNLQKNNSRKPNSINSCKRIRGGENIILYGVPGSGKSWTIKNEYCNDKTCMERLVFHPDYSYTDFVGQIMPKITSKGTVSYEFAPGPFTKLIKKAYTNPNKMFYLIIEEVNRGNAPAIFGDVFQLLDRQEQFIKNKENNSNEENPDYGASEYEITNADIAKVVYGDEQCKVSIPSNMTILCTMNTSDQNVFTLDTAFQRRWNMHLIQNKFSEDPSEKEFANTFILDTNITWEKFFTVINNLILDKNIQMTSVEDKRLGTHFISREDLFIDTYNGKDEELIKKAKRQNKKFAEKVLKYLWDDAFKFNRDDIFNISKANSLEKMIEIFIGEKENARFKEIFKQNIVDALKAK